MALISLWIALKKKSSDPTLYRTNTQLKLKAMTLEWNGPPPSWRAGTEPRLVENTRTNVDGMRYSSCRAAEDKWSGDNLYFFIPGVPFSPTGDDDGGVAAPLRRSCDSTAGWATSISTSYRQAAKPLCGRRAALLLSIHFTFHQFLADGAAFLRTPSPPRPHFAKSNATIARFSKLIRVHLNAKFDVICRPRFAASKTTTTAADDGGFWSRLMQ